ncbi:hypothetical protein BHE74_00027422 [Ensete ventricosum]|nr:hypothetical protein BHE74_00027422 [Ensete ventricosum]
MAYAAGAWAGGRSEGGESEKVGSFGATLQSLSPLCSDASLLKEEICCTRSYGGRARGRWLKCRGPGRGCSTSPRVQWDEAAGIDRPERVSPWEIEPFDATVLVTNVPQPAVVKCKRSRQPTDTADLSVLAAVINTEAENVEAQVTRPSMQKGCKENNILFCSNSHEAGLFDWLKEVQSPIRSSGSLLTGGLLNRFRETNEVTKFNSCPAYSSCMVKEQSVKLGSAVAELKKPGGGSTSYRLFGFDLFDHPRSRASTDMVTTHFSEVVDPMKHPANLSESVEDSDQKSGLSKASKEQKHSLQDSLKEIRSAPNCLSRSRTKVSVLLCPGPA